MTGEIPSDFQLQKVLLHGEPVALVQQSRLFLPGGGTDGPLQSGLLRPQGGETGVIGLRHGEGGQPAAVRVQQIQRPVHGQKGQVLKGREFGVALGQLFQRHQEVLDLKQLHQIKGIFRVPVQGSPNVVEQGEAPGHTSEKGRRILQS